LNQPQEHPSRAARDLPGAAPPVRRRAVLGVPLAMVDYERTMDAMDEMVASGTPGYVCCSPVHAVMVARDDPEMMSALRGSTLAVPDGMPLVWAAKLLGESISNRVYGPELMLRYSDRCAEQGHRVWLYGGRDQGALAQLALNMRTRHPGIRIVGGFSPPFRDLTAREEEELVARVNEQRPDVVWVGIGVPKQEKWMARMRDRLDAPVLVGVGAAFDFHAGLVPQAPDWMQRFGLEWAYRLGHEPRRLWKRYARYNPLFVFGFARQYAQHRRAARRVS
jgi:N-acetylglucosaminyldiphosphoundecaprenol N-acetyl-beta-D-mannosaminyltransferase